MKRLWKAVLYIGFEILINSSWQEKYKLLILNSKQIELYYYLLDFYRNIYFICCDLWQLLRIHTENMVVVWRGIFCHY